ncbi:MAG TPA: transposase [Cyclobacteriaceae bacterium]
MSEKYKIRNQDCPYFITFAVEEWVDVFTRQYYKDIIVNSLKHCQQNKGLIIYAWCLMTNHIHLIVGRKGENNIEEIVRDFKKYTSVHICRAIESNDAESRKHWLLRLFKSAALNSTKHIKYKFWQNEYHPVELFSNEMVDQKLEYVHDNPVKEGIVDKPEDYLYSSARDYAGTKGLLEIEFMD